MTEHAQLRLSKTYSFDSPKQTISLYSPTMLRHLAVTMSQGNSKKEFVFWDTKGIIPATHLEGAWQRRQGWLDYWRTRYNC